MIHNDVANINKCLWKLKAPLNIKVLVGYLCRGVVLTKDNLVKCNWHDSKQYYFLHKDETYLAPVFFSAVLLGLSICYSGGFRPVSTT